MKVTRTIQITSGIAPFEVTLDVCSCASASTQSFVAATKGLYSVTIDFPGDCFDDCEVEVVVTDSDGCREVLDFMLDLDNPCDALEVDILRNGYSFFAEVTGGTGPFTYSWSYTNIFRPIGPLNGATANFEIATDLGASPPFGNVSVFVEDSNGCTHVVTENVQLCAPVVYTMQSQVIVPCISVGLYEVDGFACRGNEIDWTTFQVDNVTDLQGNQRIGDVWLVPDCPTCRNGKVFYNIQNLELLKTGGSFYVYWSVADSNGVRSASTLMEVVIYPCNFLNPTPPLTNDCQCNLRAECEETENERGVSLFVDLNACFSKCDCEDPEKQIDVSTFQVIAGPYIPGAYVIFDPATLNLNYYAPAGSVGVDVVEYVVCNEAGDSCSGISTATFYLNCIDQPELHDDSACTNCGLPIELNVLANDVGVNIDPNSLTIVDQPSHGIVYINSDHNVVYTPFGSFAGIDTFTYTVSNYGGQGGFADPATVTITVSCAGEGEEITICDPEAVPVAAISSNITCNTTINEAAYNIVLGGWIDYSGTPIALDAADIVHLESAGIGLNVDLIVGQNPLLPAGYTNDVAGNWAALIPYMMAGTMTPSSLLAGTYTITFDKKGWADDNNYHNIYNTTSGAQTQSDALSFSISAEVVDVSEAATSTTVSTTIKKVKILAFEDTSRVGYDIKPKGVGTWSGTADPTTGCNADCVSSPLNSWYSQLQPSPCSSAGLTKPPSWIVKYKRAGEAEVTLSPGVALTLANAEQELVLALNSFGNYNFRYVPCGSAALATYGVKGYNGTFVVSCYLVEDALLDMEYFEIEYENGTSNDGKVARMTLDSIVLF